MKTKIFTLYLALVASVGILRAESGTCGSNLTWDLTGGILTINGTGEMYDWKSWDIVPWASCASSITSVIVGKGVTTVGQHAFDGCSSLNSVVWNAKKSFMPAHYYRDIEPFGAVNKQITSFILGNEVENLPNYLFYGMDKLTSIAIPNSVKSIGAYVFTGCTGLTSISIPNSVTYIEGYAFEDCYTLKSVTIGNSVTGIEEGTFFGCTGLTSITIPNSATHIESTAFYGCSGLTSLIIGNGVRSIEDRAFYGCTGLTSIRCEAVEPPCFNCNGPGEDGDVFYGVDPFIPLYVPAGSVDAYAAADQWNYFRNIQAIGGSPSEGTMTCAEAREAALRGETAYVSVVGYVTAIVENWSSKYKNISFWMADTKDGGRVFEVFRAKCSTQNEAPVVGDKVKVMGKLSVYNSTTPEIEAGGTFEILEHTTNAVESVISSPSPVTIKFIKNGQLYILYGRKKYSIIGTEVP